MYIIKLLDIRTKNNFEKVFTSFYLYNKFLQKLRYSKKLMILSTSKF